MNEAYNKQVTRGFYIIEMSKGSFITNYNEFMNDNRISNFLGIDYPVVMIQKFNGELSPIGEIYFKNKQDAENALEYVNALALMYCLEG